MLRSLVEALAELFCCSCGNSRIACCSFFSLVGFGEKLKRCHAFFRSTVSLSMKYQCSIFPAQAGGVFFLCDRSAAAVLYCTVLYRSKGWAVAASVTLVICVHVAHKYRRSAVLRVWSYGVPLTALRW